MSSGERVPILFIYCVQVTATKKDVIPLCSEETNTENIFNISTESV